MVISSIVACLLMLSYWLETIMLWRLFVCLLQCAVCWIAGCDCLFVIVEFESELELIGDQFGGRAGQLVGRIPRVALG